MVPLRVARFARDSCIYSQWLAHQVWPGPTKPQQWYSHISSIAAFSTSSECRDSDLQGLVTIIPMPQLSPHMKSGTIQKWLRKAGEEIATYDVIFEITTESLSEEAYKVGDFAGSVTMLVEAQEDGFLGKILVEAGQEVEVNTPVAVMCELEHHLQTLQENQQGLKQLLHEHEKLKKISWQSYLKEGGSEKKSCS